MIGEGAIAAPASPPEICDLPALARQLDIDDSTEDGGHLKAAEGWLKAAGGFPVVASVP